MDCRNLEEVFLAGLDGKLSLEQATELQRHLAACPQCLEEAALLQMLWDGTRKIAKPEPSQELGRQLNTMLTAFKEAALPVVSPWERFREFWLPKRGLAYLFLGLTIGVLIGFSFLKNSAGKREELAGLNTRLDALTQTVTLALLQNPSASERIKGISYTSGLRSADNRVTVTLLETLNNDPDVNVRLRALDALTQLSADPAVRTGLIAAVLNQDSPIVQSAIADVMLQLQDKRSVGALKRLLKRKQLNPEVKQKIKETLNQLI